MFRHAALIAIIMVTTGCAVLGPKSINPSEFQHVSIPMNTNPPTEAQLTGERIKVVVFQTENKAELAKRLNIGAASTGAIEGYVAESAELIDRSMASKLKDEILLIEVNGAGSWDGPSVADYAVMSNLSLAKSSSKFREAYSYQDKKGKTHYVGPKCSYNADVAGNLMVYKLPSLTLVDAIKISGGKSESEDVRANYWFSRGSRCNNSDERTSGLLQKAASNAIDRERTKLQNHFAPKGYITERRGGKDGDIFKISLGSINGAKKGLSIEIHREEMVVNPLTKKSESEVIPLGVAEITDQVEDHYSWVFIGDKEEANTLMLGDTVTILFETSLFEKVANFTKK